MTSNISQWLFPISALQATPSTCSLEKELYDRARGIEFLFRLGSSLALPTSAMCTSATWFHRFYMRFSMEDFHRQDVAASCIFLATKTEECGRKLRDVARIYEAKILNCDITKVAVDSPEVDQRQAAILLTEEVLLEALCFDFVIESPHAELVELFETCESDSEVQEYAWSLAHDSYRTPMCILFPPNIIATACYVLAQRISDGPNSLSLDARISASSPSSHLPTPPSHKPPSPDASRLAIERQPFSESELSCISEALNILLEFYKAQDVNSTYPYLSSIVEVSPPSTQLSRPRFFVPVSQINVPETNASVQQPSQEAPERTPLSSYGGQTPETNTFPRQNLPQE